MALELPPVPLGGSGQGLIEGRRLHAEKLI